MGEIAIGSVAQLAEEVQAAQLHGIFGQCEDRVVILRVVDPG